MTEFRPLLGKGYPVVRRQAVERVLRQTRALQSRDRFINSFIAHLVTLPIAIVAWELLVRQWVR